MRKSPILLAIAFSAFVATGTMMNVNSASAAPPCPSGAVCPPDGTMHKPQPGDGAGMQNPNDNQSRHWRHRRDPNIGFGIYVNDGYGDGNGNSWRHRKHCRIVKIWRHHHPILVKRCVWSHRY